MIEAHSPIPHPEEIHERSPSLRALDHFAGGQKEQPRAK